MAAAKRAQVATATSTSGDALDDDFDMDDSLLAPDVDDDEDNNGHAVGAASSSSSRRGESSSGKPARRTLRPMSPSEEDEFVLEDDNDDDDDIPEQQEDDEHGLPVGKKRKLDDASNAPQLRNTGQDQQSTAADRKRRRREKLKDAKRRKTQLIDDAEALVDTSLIAEQPPALQADFLAEMQSQAMPKMSVIEIDEFRVAESYLIDTTSITSRKSLSEFVKQGLHLSEDDLKPAAGGSFGAPRLLVVSGAALRVADVVRDMRTLAGKGEVAKLFAKHFKLKEHCTYCQKTAFTIGAGTPDRIQKLIEAEAVSLGNLTHIVLDMAKDSKKRNLLDIPESRIALFKLLGTPRVHQKLQQGVVKLVMC